MDGSYHYPFPERIAYPQESVYISNDYELEKAENEVTKSELDGRNGSGDLAFHPKKENANKYFPYENEAESVTERTVNETESMYMLPSLNGFRFSFDANDNDSLLSSNDDGTTEYEILKPMAFGDNRHHGQKGAEQRHDPIPIVSNYISLPNLYSCIGGCSSNNCLAGSDDLSTIVAADDIKDGVPIENNPYEDGIMNDEANGLVYSGYLYDQMAPEEEYGVDEEMDHGDSREEGEKEKQDTNTYSYYHTKSLYGWNIM